LVRLRLLWPCLANAGNTLPAATTPPPQLLYVKPTFGYRGDTTAYFGSCPQELFGEMHSIGRYAASSRANGRHDHRRLQPPE
jgi:hypothetical protein